MINSSVIISGEASETDSDEDNNHNVNDMPTSIQAAIITGEDSESDDENQGSISSAVSVLTQTKSEEAKKEVSESDMNKSLLHKKLKECNNQMYTDLESFCQNMINQAGKNLSTIDQQLMKSQNTLQTAVTSLRSLHINSAAIKDRLQNIISSKFLTNIK
ncbi:hypothetical protein RN001_005690 [Aquatica leii]|uniref:Biogenesis of lysosome-related organelles complex 1 subunit 3 n=1 Tax=Aquatica leii TaxID=1421715 RepID=A0AAN7PHD4_9COLE|nr:hypothetical protein RN001_005690 [Aquatica leii]